MIKLVLINILFLSSKLFLQTEGKIFQYLKPDHINIVVNNLQEAEEFFHSIGFKIKEGRIHANSIQNKHIKFSDGTSIELIKADSAMDELSGFYVRFLSENPDGAAAFGSLRYTESIEESLMNLLFNMKLEAKKENLGYAKLITLHNENSILPLFFINFKSNPKDSFELTNHDNSVLALTKIYFNPIESLKGLIRSNPHLGINSDNSIGNISKINLKVENLNELTQRLKIAKVRFNEDSNSVSFFKYGLIFECLK